MTTIIEETVTSPNDSSNVVLTTPVKSGATNSETNEYLVYYFFGALETLLLFRLILKIAGASLNSWFVSIIYTLSRFFVMPFEGMFRKVTTQGVETTSVFEPATVVAIVVYAIVAYGIVKLIRISSGEKQIEGGE